MKKLLFIAVTILFFIAGTVYAYASETDFEFSDDDCGITVINGTDAAVNDGKLTVSCTDEAIVFDSGTVSVENNGYIVFSVRSENDISGATVEVSVNKYSYPALSLKGVSANVFAVNLNDISSTVSSFSIKVSALSGEGNKICLDYIRFPSSISVNYDIEKYCTIFSALSEKISVTTAQDAYTAFVTSYNTKGKFTGAKMYSNETVPVRVAENTAKSKVIFLKSRQTLEPLGEELNVSMVCEFSEWI